MRQKSMKSKEPAEKVVRDIRRRTRRQYSSEEKIRIVLEGLRGEESIAGLCRREGIAEGLYYSWSKEFLGEAQAPLVRAKRRTARSGWQVTPSAKRQAAR
jgi:transposase